MTGLGVYIWVSHMSKLMCCFVRLFGFTLSEHSELEVGTCPSDHGCGGQHRELFVSAFHGNGMHVSMSRK